MRARTRPGTRPPSCRGSSPTTGRPRARSRPSACSSPRPAGPLWKLSRRGRSTCLRLLRLTSLIGTGRGASALVVTATAIEEGGAATTTTSRATGAATTPIEGGAVIGPLAARPEPEPRRRRPRPRPEPARPVKRKEPARPLARPEPPRPEPEPRPEPAGRAAPRRRAGAPGGRVAAGGPRHHGRRDCCRARGGDRGPQGRLRRRPIGFNTALIVASDKYTYKPRARSRSPDRVKEVVHVAPVVPSRGAIKTYNLNIGRDAGAHARRLGLNREPFPGAIARRGAQ